LTSDRGRFVLTVFVEGLLIDILARITYQTVGLQLIVVICNYRVMIKSVDDVLREKLLFNWSDFPPITKDLAGTGGVIRQELEDFIVEEIPLYLPQGKGSHAYVRIEKRGITTRDVVVALLDEGLSQNQIGVAGLKDKFAVASQWLSVPNRFAYVLDNLDNLDGVRVLERSRHKNKLGMGHLEGNKFTIRIRDADDDAANKAKAIVEKLAIIGVPNYFGPQRFGRFGTNAVDGYKLILGEKLKGGHKLKKFFLSSLQSLMFNYILAKRIEMNIFDSLILGDWAKKHDTLGVFKVEDLKEAERAKRLEVSATIPLFGKKTKMADADAGQLEQDALDYYELKWVNFARRRGDRRFSRLPMGETKIIEQDDGLTIEFFLRRGSFATSILREIMKVEVDSKVDRAKPDSL